MRGDKRGGEGDERMNTETLNLDIIILNAFISLWLCKTRIEIENLCKDNQVLREDMLKSQLSNPMRAWHNIQEKLKIPVVDVEDCRILGYSWEEIKQIINFAKSKGFNNAPLHPLP